MISEWNWRDFTRIGTERDIKLLGVNIFLLKQPFSINFQVKESVCNIYSYQKCHLQNLRW